MNRKVGTKGCLKIPEDKEKRDKLNKQVALEAWTQNYKDTKPKLLSLLVFVFHRRGGGLSQINTCHQVP